MLAFSVTKYECGLATRINTVVVHTVVFDKPFSAIVANNSIAIARSKDDGSTANYIASYNITLWYLLSTLSISL